MNRSENSSTLMHESLVTQIFLGVFVFFFCGCSQPIYSPPTVTPILSEADLDQTQPSDFYEWPLIGNMYGGSNHYIRLKFLDRVQQPISIPDANMQQSGDWSSEALTPVARTFLTNAISSYELRLKPTLRIPISKASGDLYFNLSPSGKRLAVVDSDQLKIYSLDDGIKESVSQPIGKIIRMDDSENIAVQFSYKEDFLYLFGLKEIVKIDLSTNIVVAKCSGCKEELDDVCISQDSEKLLLLTKSGSVFFINGDLQDKQAITADFPGEVTSISLSPSGRVLGATVNSTPTLSLIEDLQIVQQTAATFSTVGKADAGVVAWTTHDNFIHASWDDELDSAQWTLTPLLWKAHAVTMHQLPLIGDSFLVLADRSIDGKKEPVLFDNSPRWEMNSMPQILDDFPKRLLASTDAETIAFSTENAIQVLRRPVWRTVAPTYVRCIVAELLRLKQFEQLDQIVKTISRQKQTTMGMTPQSLVGLVIRCIALEWRDYIENDDQATLAALDAWLTNGGQTAILARSFAHYYRGRNLRASNYQLQSIQDMKSVQDEFENAQQLSVLVMETEDSPNAAYEIGSVVGMEFGQQLVKVDKLLLESIQRYPGEIRILSEVARMLTPQAKGRGGESESFVDAVSDIHSQDLGNLIYFYLVSRVYRAQGTYNSVHNSERLMKGIEEAERRGLEITSELWSLWLMETRANDKNGHASHYLNLLEQRTPLIPKWVSSGPGANFVGEIRTRKAGVYSD